MTRRKPGSVGPYRKRRPLEERLWEKVDRRGDDDCWDWLGSLGMAGYGQFFTDGVQRPAHRFMYEFLVGPVPAGLVIDHLCRRPCCVNPRHMEPVTNYVNILRGVGPSAKAARQTHCKRGHPLEGRNVYRHPKSRRRECVACRQLRAAGKLDV